MPERLYSTYQVADLLGTSPAEVAEWIERGWLPFRRSGNGPVRISARGLLNFLEQRGIDIRALVTAAELREEEQVYAQASPGPALPVLPAPDRARTEGASGRQRSSSRGPAWQVVEAVLDDAVARGAGDIHLELRGQRLTLLLQVDGVLREKPHFAARLPEGLGPEVMRAFKSLAGLEAQECRRVQEGGFVFDAGGLRRRFRAFTCPTLEGERLVIRVLEDEPTESPVGDSTGR